MNRNLLIFDGLMALMAILFLFAGIIFAYYYAFSDGLINLTIAVGSLTLGLGYKFAMEIFDVAHSEAFE